MEAILIVHIISTAMLCGLIWTVQIVHYPLFAHVGSDAFPAYESAHISRITLIVFPLMATELLTAFWLVAVPIEGFPRWFWALGLALVLAIWASTAFINAPQHSALAANFDLQIHRALVLSNWIRTILWSIRTILIFWVLWRLIAPLSAVSTGF